MHTHKTCYNFLALAAAASVFCGISTFAQDIIETPTRVFRGRVRMADAESITIEKMVDGRPREVTIPRNIVRRLKVEPPPSVITGIEAYEAGDWRQAKLNLERVILNYQGLDTDWAQKGMVYFGRASMFSGDDESADRAFSAFLNAYPDHELVIEAKLGQADVRRARKDYDAALEMFRALAEPFEGQLRPTGDELPYAAEAYLGIGRCLEAKEDYQGAFDAYVKIVALYPAERIYPEALFKCALVSARQQNLDKSLRYLAELVDEYPASEFARSGLQLRSAIEKRQRAMDDERTATQ